MFDDKFVTKSFNAEEYEEILICKFKIYFLLRVLRALLSLRVEKACHARLASIARYDYYSNRSSAPCVIDDSVPRVVMTSGSSVTSISVPSGRASAASSSASNSSVRVMRTPA